MPCQDHQGEAENEQMRERVDKLTRMLCGLCQRAEQRDPKLGLLREDPELAQWWEEHKQADFKRKHLEALMQAKALIESGYAGVNSKGKIVDRRVHPEAIPIPENKLFGTPKPK